MFGNSTISRLTGIGFISLLFCGAFASTAMAIPFKFTFSSTVDTFSGIPGVSVGNPLTLVVIADNGGSDAISQTWGPADVLSANLAVGTYLASYDPLPNLAIFVTDASGSFSFFNSTNFVDSSGTNTDSIPQVGNPAFLPGMLIASDSNIAFFSPFANFEPSWTLMLAQPPPTIPEPGTLVLFGVGLAFCTIARRRTGNTRRS